MTRLNTSLRAHRTHSRLAVLATGAALTLALAGCGAPAADDDDLPTVTPGPAMSTPASSPDVGGGDSADGAPAEDADLATTDFPVTPDQAVKTAVGSDGGAVVTKVELDHSREHGGWVYEIDTQNGTEQHEVKVDATSGEIVADKTDTENDPAVAVDLSTLSPEDAMAAATGVQNGTVSG